MNDPSGTPLQVDLFLSHGRASGVTRDVKGRLRLIDILNTLDDVFCLESATVVMNSMAQGREFPSLNLEKRAIVAAVPRETAEQMRQRSMLNAVVGKTRTAPMQAAILLPPFVAEGTVHVPQGIGTVGAKLHADAGIFGKFIPMTDARLTLPNGATVEAPVLLINRDLVAGTSVIAAKPALRNAI